MKKSEIARKKLPKRVNSKGSESEMTHFFLEKSLLINKRGAGRRINIPKIA